MSLTLRFADTSDEALKVYAGAYQSLSGADRVERAMAMADEVKQVTLAGIAHRNPDFGPAEVHRRWLEILHGDALARLIS